MNFVLDKITQDKNGVKGVMTLNNRFYLLSVIKKAIAECNGLSPNGTASGFEPLIGCSTQPSPSFSLRYC